MIGDKEYIDKLMFSLNKLRADKLSLSYKVKHLDIKLRKLKEISLYDRIFNYKKNFID